MLTDIKLSEDQLRFLKVAAEFSGGELDQDYMGEFRPADSLQCVALFCTSPGQLIRFAVSLAHVDRLLAGQLAARVQEDGPYRPGGKRAYYWPGVVVA